MHVKRKTYYAASESDAALAHLKERYSQSSESDLIRLLLIAAAEGNVALVAKKPGRRQ